jgi:hypothetical protein
MIDVNLPSMLIGGLAGAIGAACGLYGRFLRESEGYRHPEETLVIDRGPDREERSWKLYVVARAGRRYPNDTVYEVLSESELFPNEIERYWKPLLRLRAKDAANV